MQPFQTVYDMLQAETAVPLTVGNVFDVISITHEYQISKVHNAAVIFLKERVQYGEICGPAYAIAKRMDIKLILDVMQSPSFRTDRLGSFFLNDAVFEALPQRLTDEQIGKNVRHCIFLFACNIFDTYPGSPGSIVTTHTFKLPVCKYKCKAILMLLLDYAGSNWENPTPHGGGRWEKPRKLTRFEPIQKFANNAIAEESSPK
jgi:hypothetical protein